VYGRKGSWPDMLYCGDIRLEALKKTTIDLSDRTVGVTGDIQTRDHVHNCMALQFHHSHWHC
jgi:hypothetical protein